MERMWLFHEELRISSSSTAHPCPFLGLTLAPAHDTSVSDIWARRNDAALDAAQPAYNTRPTAPGKAASSNSPAPTCSHGYIYTPTSYMYRYQNVSRVCPV